MQNALKVFQPFVCLFEGKNMTELLKATDFSVQEDAENEYFSGTEFLVQEDAKTEYLSATDYSVQEHAKTENREPPDGFPSEETILPQQVKLIEVQVEHSTDVSENAKPTEELAKIVQFELAEGARRSLPKVEFDCQHRVIKLCNAQPVDQSLNVVECGELSQHKFIRLSSESILDVKGPQLDFLSNLCLAARSSEEFFLSVARNQWMRTIISSEKSPEELFSPILTMEERGKLFSSIIIHSNILPRDPFWTKMQSTRNEASRRVHFPCAIFKKALQEGNPLMHNVHEWRRKKEPCDLGQNGFKRSVDGNSKKDPLKLLWNIQSGDMSRKELARGSCGIVWLVTWRGGLFVRKDCVRRSSREDDYNCPNTKPFKDAIERELNVVEPLSNEHIVYCFGVSHAVNKSSIFMEYMPYNLYQLIIEKVEKTGDSEPPFPHHDSIDIILQCAKGMADMHVNNVVHGDLKSSNILVSEILISENEKRYLAKVADFDNAQSMNLESTGNFQPGWGTTKYSAPELLKWLGDKTEVICFPKALDVYSFGIVAFEVLTGEELYCNVRSRKKLRQGVIEGTLRPPLRKECRKRNFLNDERLISLVESCWQGDPSKRPSFEDIVKDLSDINREILKPTPRNGYLQPLGKFVNSFSLFGG